ncbi:tRNA (adenosine(37)-N6)-threonylcarbamoyltransferase complex ATPase subunit type 1 TsaE [soil metagenome]
MILADAAATERAGARLAALVRGGDAIALIGDLGAGKTTFTAGLVTALGGAGAHSPTFSLVHQYAGGRLIVWHADLYRLERAAELIELGLDDVLGDRRGLVIVEWADNFPVMPADHLRVELRHTGDQRELVAAGTGRRGRELAAAFDTSAAADLG